ncbi:hypothetical protein TNCV_3122431 [Trichonephila clavipes]|nr:hypothetical protein TNCV_3122431 [Trichonephila clavipes]
MGDFTYAENANRYHMYGRGNGNVTAALRMNHAQFPDRRMLANRPESSTSTRTVAHHVNVNNQIVCRVLSENRSHLFHFQ